MILQLRLIISLMLLLCAAPALAAPPEAPGPKDRCPVCGMYVSPYPSWVSVIQFADGSKAYFDGPKDLFTYYFDRDKYLPGTSDKEISGVYVTEYYSTRLMKAEEVFFVVSSDVLGPMGHELVPIQNLETADTFMRDHGGKKIMRFDGEKMTPVTGKQ